jgi:hypothetical protein
VEEIGRSGDGRLFLCLRARVRIGGSMRGWAVALDFFGTTYEPDPCKTVGMEGGGCSDRSLTPDPCTDPCKLWPFIHKDIPLVP